MRLFIAIDMNDEIRQGLIEVQNSLRIAGRAVPPEKFHLTLAFIGEYPNPEAVLNAMESATFTPFDFTLSDLGTSKNDVVWASAADYYQLNEIAKRIREVLSAARIPFDSQPFYPHITLFRKAETNIDLSEVKIPTLTMAVNKITLFRSDNGVYTPLGSVKATVKNIFWTGNHKAYYWENDILCSIPDPVMTREQFFSFANNEDLFIAELANLGYHPVQLRFADFLDRYVGHNHGEFLDAIKKRAANNAKRSQSRESPAVSRVKWVNQRDRFDGWIIGIDKQYFNMHSTGSSVCILLKSSEKNERAAFVKENCKDILSWCTEEIPSQPRIMKKIGSIDYYNPTEITLLANNEIEVFYEVKKVVDIEEQPEEEFNDCCK